MQRTVLAGVPRSYFRGVFAYRRGTQAGGVLDGEQCLASQVAPARVLVGRPPTGAAVSTGSSLGADTAKRLGARASAAPVAAGQHQQAHPGMGASQPTFPLSRTRASKGQRSAN